MQCPQCQRRYDSDTAFCMYCGVGVVANHASPINLTSQRTPTAPQAPGPAAANAIPIAQTPSPESGPGAVRAYSAVPPSPGTLSIRAVVALVAGILGISPLAIILGHTARANIRTYNQTGNGLTIAALVLGSCTLPIFLINVGIFITAIAQAGR